MSAYIIDASVGLKWFIPEVHSSEARRWRGVGELHAPAFFFFLEIGNILWKKVGRGEITRADADAILKQLPSLPLIRHPESPLLAGAFELAIQSKRTVYDCLYLALAERLGGEVVTADERLFNSLQSTRWTKSIRWVADVPAR